MSATETSWLGRAVSVGVAVAVAVGGAVGVASAVADGGTVAVAVGTAVGEVETLVVGTEVGAVTGLVQPAAMAKTAMMPASIAAKTRGERTREAVGADFIGGSLSLVDDRGELGGRRAAFLPPASRAALGSQLAHHS